MSYYDLSFYFLYPTFKPIHTLYQIKECQEILPVDNFYRAKNLSPFNPAKVSAILAFLFIIPFNPIFSLFMHGHNTLEHQLIVLSKHHKIPCFWTKKRKGNYKIPLSNRRFHALLFYEKEREHYLICLLKHVSYLIHCLFKLFCCLHAHLLLCL